MNKTYLSFFHNSDYYYKDLPALFKPRLREENKNENLRPSFYWFCEHWHSNFPNLRSKYFYLFVKNPKDDSLDFTARHGGNDFNALYAYYKQYQKDKSKKKLNKLYHFNKLGEYCEPSILMSYSDITPDLVISFSDVFDLSGEVIEPKTYKGTRIKFFDDNYFPINFIDIPEILKIIPHIKDSFPFISPKIVNGKFFYSGWSPR